MKKLTKKFIKKELQHLTFKNERIADVQITNSGKCAQIITISKEHIPGKYIMKIYGKRVLTFYATLDYDVEEMFNKPLSVTEV